MGSQKVSWRVMATAGMRSAHTICRGTEAWGEGVGVGVGVCMGGSVADRHPPPVFLLQEWLVTVGVQSPPEVCATNDIMAQV